MSVCVVGVGGGHAYIKQRRLVNIRVWRINTIYFFLRRRGLCSTHHSTGWRTGASPEVKNRLVPSVAFAGKDGVQILYDGGKGGGCKRHAAVEHQKYINKQTVVKECFQNKIKKVKL